MGLYELRTQRGMTQRELARQSGVNFRSLQDYEQGHKKLSSAKVDVLVRLSTVLGCSIEELLEFPGAELLRENTVDINLIQSQRIFCEKYNIAGRWVCSSDQVAILFYYEGQQHTIPFRAIFTPKMLPCLILAAGLAIEEAMDTILLQKSGFEIW